MTRLFLFISCLFLLGMPMNGVAQSGPSLSFKLPERSVLNPEKIKFDQHLLRTKLGLHSAQSSLKTLEDQPTISIMFAADAVAFQGSDTSFPSSDKKQGMFSNRRAVYSSLWAFTSLNYLYADLVGIMDMNLLNQYQTGVVNGIEITPGFLTAAAAYMQLPLANVFLPQVIKNEKALRWVQIISGSIATLVQGATLFVGEPSPYYILFSAIEMGTTAFITIDAIRWKPGKKKS